MTYALLLAFFRNDMGFGGNNGLTDFKDILGFNIQADGTRAALFAASALALAVSLVVTSGIVRSKFGKVLVALRDAESRTRFLGYRVEHMKLFAFTVSAMMAGVAGALYVPQVGIINPGEFAPANSIEVVIWTAVGGRGTLIGPIVGAILVNGGKSIFTAAFPEFWLFALGGLFVLVTLFLPKGVVGTAQNYLASRRASHAAARKEARAKKRRALRTPKGGRGVIAMTGKKPRNLLYLDGVSVSFDGFKALNSLSFVVEPGELRAIIGPNGAGKTTMMDIITGKTRPDEGEVFFKGDIDLTKKDEAAIAELGIGRKFQKPTVFENQRSGTIWSWR